MKKLVIVGLAGLALLSACGAPPPPTASSTASPEPPKVAPGTVLSAGEVSLPDGRTVICVTGVGYDGSYSVSCDWENAK